MAGIANKLRGLLKVQTLVVVLAVLGAGAAINMGLVLFADNGIEVTVDGDGNSVSIPRAPSEVSALAICENGRVQATGTDAAPDALPSGFQAQANYLEADDSVTFYSMSLTLDELGKPKDQISVFIDGNTDDPILDFRDGVIDGKYRHTEWIPFDQRVYECMKDRA